MRGRKDPLGLIIADRTKPSGRKRSAPEASIAQPQPTAVTAETLVAGRGRVQVGRGWRRRLHVQLNLREALGRDVAGVLMMELEVQLRVRHAGYAQIRHLCLLRSGMRVGCN